MIGREAPNPTEMRRVAVRTRPDIAAPARLADLSVMTKEGKEVPVPGSG